MKKFFKIGRPNKQPFVVFSKNGWSGLIGLIECIPEPETYIQPLSWREFIIYILRGKNDE